MLNKSVSTVLIAMVLAGCSAIAPIVSAIIPAVTESSPSLDVSAQVGKDNDRSVISTGDDNKVEAGDNAQIESTKQDSVGVAIKSASNSKIASNNNVKQVQATEVAASSVGNVTTATKVENIEAKPGSNVVVNHNESPSMWWTLLLIVGWVLPSPFQMWEWLKKQLE